MVSVPDQPDDYDEDVDGGSHVEFYELTPAGEQLWKYIEAAYRGGDDIETIANTLDLTVNQVRLFTYIANLGRVRILHE